MNNTLARFTDKRLFRGILPYRKETLHLLHELAEDAANDDLSKGDHLRRIQQLRGGVPYWYMYKKHFPELRASRLYLWYEKVWNPIAPMPMPSIELPVPEEHISFQRIG